MKTKRLPHGTWQSPITASMVAEQLPYGPGRYEGVVVDESRQRIHYIEARPTASAATRSVIVSVSIPPSSSASPTSLSTSIPLADGSSSESGRGEAPFRSEDVLPEPYSARSLVHGYGGAAMGLVPATGEIVFTDAGTGGVFLLDLRSGSGSGSRGCKVTQVVREENVRFADFDCVGREGGVMGKGGRIVLAVQEDLRLSASPHESIDRIVAIDLQEEVGRGRVKTLVEGADFYAHPRWSPDGRRICWVQWDHPDVSWRASRLFVADWDAEERVVRNVENVAGGEESKGKEERRSIAQPRWGVDGRLFYASDRTGYWQLYAWDGEAGEKKEGEEKGSGKKIDLPGLEEAEFAAPEFLSGDSTYVQLSSTTMVATTTKAASTSIVLITGLDKASTPEYSTLDIPLIDVRFQALRRISESSFVVTGSTPTTPKGIYHVSLSTTQNTTNQTPTTSSPILTRLTPIPASLEPIDKIFYSNPQHISFPRIYGTLDGESHAFHHAPYNPNFTAPPDALPPAIIFLHGGPTGNVTPALSLETQYWTTRGYAVLNLNYSGSSGYGRSYREALYGAWGLHDTDDIASLRHYMIEQRLADPTRIGIRGPSAGGFATLSGLTRYPRLWAGGVSLFGVADLRKLIDETHKFEAGYVASLVYGDADLSEDEKEKVCRERSPVFMADGIEAPVLLISGAEDTVVPPGQTREIAGVIESNGGTVRTVIFEGEGHGCRMKKNLQRSIEEEEAWWRKTLVG